MDSKTERILWSIATPGFGQFLNGKFLKGALFISLEFAINVKAHLNQVIMLSFQGRTADAIQTADFQWLMFYPCIYMFAIWDAFKDTGGGLVRLSYLPFVLPAYLGTVGVIYSPNVKMLGPVWFPMILALIGIVLGWVLRKVL